MKFTTAMLFGLALIVGVAIGYMFNPSVGEPVPVEKHAKAKGSIADKGETAMIAVLQRRIAELEAQLAKWSENASRAEKKEERVEGKRENRGPFGGMSPKEWREKMQKEDPERYAQMTNGMARMMRRRQERAQRKANFLASVDTSRMSASARKTHTELQDLLAKREELEQKMHEMHESDTMPTEDEMQEFGQTMHELNQQIRKLNAQERDNLMVETAKSLGFNENEASEVAEVFQEIMENTDGGHGFHGPGGNDAGGNGTPPPMAR